LTPLKANFSLVLFMVFLKLVARLVLIYPDGVQTQGAKKQLATFLPLHTSGRYPSGWRCPHLQVLRSKTYHRILYRYARLHPLKIRIYFSYLYL
jgi:hypothetical protein